jgi:hypothetical protein
MVNANYYARGRWSIRRRRGSSRGCGWGLGRKIEELMEDRYGVSRSGTYVENVRSWLDPGKEILAGMRVLQYHGVLRHIHNNHIGREMISHK